MSAVWRIGETLPWTAAWTGEDRFKVAPSAAFPGRLEIVQAEAPGEGTPVLTGMHLMRQRRAVTQFLCQVCGGVAPPGDRWLFPTATGAFVRLKGGARYLSHMPPTHRACADRAAALCPHLRGADAQPVAFPPDSGRLVPETSPPPGFERLAEQLPPGRVVYSYFRLYGEAFTRVARRLRIEAGVSTAPLAG